VLESNIPSFGIQLVDQERMRLVGNIFPGTVSRLVCRVSNWHRQMCRQTLDRLCI